MYELPKDSAASSIKGRLYLLQISTIESISNAWPKVCIGTQAAILFFDSLCINSPLELISDSFFKKLSNFSADIPNVFLSTSTNKV